MRKHDFTKILLALGVKPVEVNAMARTFTEDPLQKFNFTISIDGLPTSVGFQKIGGLSREIGVSTYYEAGYETEHKLKGRQVGGQLTCERGAFASKDLENLFTAALSNTDTRKDITINLQDRDGNIKRSWSAQECWVSKWEIDDLDATSDDVIIEKLTIEYESLKDMSVGSNKNESTGETE